MDSFGQFKWKGRPYLRKEASRGGLLWAGFSGNPFQVVNSVQTPASPAGDGRRRRDSQWASVELKQPSRTLVGLHPGTSVEVRVRARTAGGWSDWSEVVTVVLPEVDVPREETRPRPPPGPRHDVRVVYENVVRRVVQRVDTVGSDKTSRMVPKRITETVARCKVMLDWSCYWLSPTTPCELQYFKNEEDDKPPPPPPLRAGERPGPAAGCLFPLVVVLLLLLLPVPSPASSFDAAAQY